MGAQELLASEEDETSGPRQKLRYWSEGVLATTSAVIGKYGWLSRTKAREQGGRSTADLVADYLDAIIFKDQKRREEILPDGVSEEDAQSAKVALEWAQSVLPLRDNDLNDYMWNLRVVSSQEAVTYRELGLLSSLLPTYQREMGREIERQTKAKVGANSDFFGTDGKREVFDLTLLGIKKLSRHQFSRYDEPVTYLHRFVDDHGNVAVWYGSSELAEEADYGKKFKVKATVKGHEEYNGVKQTKLTRVSEYEVAAVKPRQKRPKAQPLSAPSALPPAEISGDTTLNEISF
jgi:hypothetical protein